MDRSCHRHRSRQGTRTGRQVGSDPFLGATPGVGTGALRWKRWNGPGEGVWLVWSFAVRVRFVWFVVAPGSRALEAAVLSELDARNLCGSVVRGC